ncbi:hypothetical protein LLH00_04420 [bacterium]|nr:hypothetical protein [bacterium]
MFNPLKNAFVARHYRTFIFSLVLINTALIFFLIVYIWSYGSESATGRWAATGTLSRRAVQPAVVVAESETAWSEPGGAGAGAVSRGVLERGLSVDIVDSTRQDGQLWYCLTWNEGRGWVPAGAVRFIQAAR